MRVFNRTIPDPKLAGVFALSIQLLGVPSTPAHAQGPTDWCSCEDGTNFPCDSGYVCLDAPQSTLEEKGAAFGQRIRESLRRLFSGDTQARREQQGYERRSEAQYGPWAEKLLKQAEQDRLQIDAEIQMEGRAQVARLARAEQSYALMSRWNDVGVDAYRRGNWGQSLRYFRTARTYAPADRDIDHNISKAQAKVREEAKQYLSSVKTDFEIEISEHILIFHPDPYIREEAQKKLVRETLEKIAEAAAQFVINEHLTAGKVTPFSWQTAEDKAARKEEARRHSEYVAGLVVMAYAEARQEYGVLERETLSGDRPIRIEPGTAMSQLFTLSFYGFE